LWIYVRDKRFLGPCWNRNFRCVTQVNAGKSLASPLSDGALVIAASLTSARNRLHAALNWAAVLLDGMGSSAVYT
jgi:hypothetical protein